MPTKPPYAVPRMAEIAATEWNGFAVASLFAGGGGSSLGYRMAGYRMAYVNEIVPEARQAYAANAMPYTVIDGSDVRNVKGDTILDAVEALTGSRTLHVLDGSPPCQSFSTAGIRHKGWGRTMDHADGTTQASDDLFFEYARLVAETDPWVFVAENVSGMVKGVAIGYFKTVMRALQATGRGYVVEAKLLDAQWLGVPQARQRLIFVGVRRDLAQAGFRPAWPTPRKYRYTMRDALPDLGPVGLHMSRGPNDPKARTVSTDEPSPTVSAAGMSNVREYQATLPASAPALHHPDDGPPKRPPALPRPVGGKDPETGHRVDLAHNAVGDEWDKLKPGESSKKYFSLNRPHPDEPSPTITATANRPGIAGVTHPLERRMFTLGELRRLCSFPDDYSLPGGYQAGWARLGNAVPPIMMRSVAEAVRDEILLPWRQTIPAKARRAAT